MFNVRLAGDHLYEKWLFTWLSLVMSLMVSNIVFCPCFHEMFSMKSGTKLGQFMRIFSSSLVFRLCNIAIMKANINSHTRNLKDQCVFSPRGHIK